MIKYMALQLVVLLALLCPQNILAAGNCDIELVEKLKKCEPYTCTMIHPQFEGAKIKHRIFELQDDGNCHYEQDVPVPQNIAGAPVLVCKYDEKTRIAAANVLKGAFDFTPTSAEDEQLLNKALQNGVCEITGM